MVPPTHSGRAKAGLPLVHRDGVAAGAVLADGVAMLLRYPLRKRVGMADQIGRLYDRIRLRDTWKS